MDIEPGIPAPPFGDVIKTLLYLVILAVIFLLLIPATLFIIAFIIHLPFAIVGWIRKLIKNKKQKKMHADALGGLGNGEVDI